MKFFYQKGVNKRVRKVFLVKKIDCSILFLNYLMDCNYSCRNVKKSGTEHLYVFPLTVYEKYEIDSKSSFKVRIPARENA